MPPTNLRRPDVSAPTKERNEYIPSFIAKKPFYVDDAATTDDHDYLEHQRLQKDSAVTDSKWYDRGQKAGPAATKYRKGACENCGSLTHKAKDCLSRPRKAGAKWTGKNIEADEVVQNIDLGWDAKRDRWNGYDAKEYAQVVAEYNEMEGLRKQAKSQSSKIEASDDVEADEEGIKYEEETDMGRQQSTATRNLRLREDTAKYLLNLDLDSAKYDPKTRSMVDSGATSDKAAALVAEEGFEKMSGDAAEFERAQRYAWESQERGDKSKLHIQANPTSGEYLRKKEFKEKTEKREADRRALFDKYGGEKHLKRNALTDIAITESERYIEYDEFGGIKEADRSKAKSKYIEDVHVNNHKSVWGSWWSDFRWGYACCHSMVKNSYCTGEKGKEAYEASTRLNSAHELSSVTTLKAVAEPTDPDDETQATNSRLAADRSAKKRTLGQVTGDLTETDMEQYRRKRLQGNDPMAKLLGRDELIDST